jgi:DNA-binding response OmpR family regulator
MPLKVMVVEDDFGILENLRALLSAKGYKVLEASDGAAAVALARKELPDLILLDILLPKMGGFDVCKILKTDAATRQIKIVMITGLSQMADVETAFQNGASDYIIKPFDADRLFRKIDKVLAGPA